MTTTVGGHKTRDVDKVTNVIVITNNSGCSSGNQGDFQQVNPTCCTLMYHKLRLLEFTSKSTRL